MCLQDWYEAVTHCIYTNSAPGSLIHRSYSLANGSMSAGLTPRGISAEPSPFASPISSFPVS